MPFPVSVSDVWKMFEWANHRKAESEKAVSEWLDRVYADLEDLSKVWRKICEALESADEAKADKERERALRIIVRGEIGISQQFLAGRLDSFYTSASRVLSTKRPADFHEDFVQSLGSLLIHRREARQILDREVSVLHTESTKETLLRMREHTAMLQKEIASLQVLIKTFEAQA